MYYPEWLEAPTEVAQAAALKRFPTKADLVPFCQCVLAQLTPYICQILRVDLRVLRMRGLMESYLDTNCPAMKDQHMQEIRISDEWQSLAQQSTINPPPVATVEPEPPESTRRPSLNFRSPLRNAIAFVLAKHPVDGRKVADFLDEYAQIEVPASLQTEAREQFFKDVYRGPNGHNLENQITTVRVKMRKFGLLPPGL
jgi:hypothetical protein